MNDIACRNCRFWEHFDKNVADHIPGQCRESSPTRALTAGPAWPVTQPTDWCGKFWQKPQDPAHPWSVKL